MTTRSEQIRALANVIDMAAHPDSAMGDAVQQRADVRAVENLMRELQDEMEDGEPVSTPPLSSNAPVVLLTMYVQRYDRGEAVDSDTVWHTDFGPDAEEWKDRLLKPVEQRDENETNLRYGTHTAREPFVAIDFHSPELPAFVEDGGAAEYLDNAWDAVVADALAASSDKSYTRMVAVRIHAVDDDFEMDWLGPVDTVTVKGQTFPIKNH